MTAGSVAALSGVPLYGRLLPALKDCLLERTSERTQAILVDRVRFSLDAGKFQQFLDLLNAPPRAGEGLERLLAVKAPWGEG